MKYHEHEKLQLLVGVVAEADNLAIVSKYKDLLE